MIIRRYYKRGIKYPYTISEEYLTKLVDEKGELQASKIDNASYEIILESVREEKNWFKDCCGRVLSNPRWYMDNLDKIPTFKVHKKVIYS